MDELLQASRRLAALPRWADFEAGRLIYDPELRRRLEAARRQWRDAVLCADPETRARRLRALSGGI